MKLTKTLTSIFFVPTLQINREGLYNNGYLNGYYSDSQKEEQYTNCIYLLFKPKNVQKFRDFLDSEYLRTKQVIDDYDYKDGYIVIVYQLDNRFKNDYELIKKGKYSQTSQEFQKLFPEVLKVYKKDGTYTDEVSLQYRVFNRTVDLKEYWESKLDVRIGDMEVWDTWYDEKETLDLEKIRELI